MGMSRKQKEAEVQELNDRFTKDETVIVTHYSGLTVFEMSELRAELRKEGATFKVTKNSLAKIAITGTKFEPIAEMFSGPTGVASSEDPVAAAKVVQKYAKGNDKLIILGGAMGEKILDVAGVEALSKMPSLDEVRSSIVGFILAPARNIASFAAAPGSRVSGAIKAAGEKNG
jgi:large subunit ribosomal protein L10